MLPAGGDPKRTSPWVKYDKGQLLGSGQHSHTYRATDKATGEQVGTDGHVCVAQQSSRHTFRLKGKATGEQVSAGRCDAWARGRVRQVAVGD